MIGEIKLRIYLHILNKFENTRNEFRKKLIIIPLLFYRIIRIYSLKIPFLYEVFVEKHLRISKKLIEKYKSQKFRIFIDIGAGDGFYSFYFAKKSYFVISFEPDIRNFSFIERIIRIFKIRNIRVFPLAITDRNSFSCLYLSNVPYANISTTEFKKKSYSKIKIKTFTLDELTKTININRNYAVLVNIDVEGSEYKVFIGGKDFIRKFKPVFVFECQKNLDKIKKYLMKEEYKIYKVDDFNYIAY
jgi:FkbM family methyltransferase